MNDKDIDITTDKAKEIIDIYNSINDANIRKLSYIDFDTLELDEKNRVNMQIEFDSKKQRKMFEDYVCKSPEYITDVLIKALQDDVRKDTLWRLFGDVIYKNLEQNLNGTKICEKCKKRFNMNNNKMKHCKECAYEIQLVLSNKYKNKIRKVT
jgi:hypothetical protein